MALLVIVLPAMAHAREKGRATVCRSNLHQLTAALLLYAQDHDGYFTGDHWDRVLVARLRVTPPFTCPDLPGARHTVRANPDEGESVPGYAVNAALFNQAFR